MDKIPDHDTTRTSETSLVDLDWLAPAIAEAKAATLPAEWRRAWRRWSHVLAAGSRPSTEPARRAQGRARRTPARRAVATSGGDDADGDGDGDPPHVERPAVARLVAPLLVSDAPATSDVLRAALSITPRQLRALVDAHQIPHSRRHAGARHILVLVADVLEALGFAAPSVTAATPEPKPARNEAEIIELAARRKVVS